MHLLGTPQPSHTQLRETCASVRPHAFPVAQEIPSTGPSSYGNTRHPPHWCEPKALRTPHIPLVPSASNASSSLSRQNIPGEPRAFQWSKGPAQSLCGLSLSRGSIRPLRNSTVVCYTTRPGTPWECPDPTLFPNIVEKLPSFRRPLNLEVRLVITLDK